MVNERSDHMLQTTALVHEAFLRLKPQDLCAERTAEEKREFFLTAARAMRRILVDEARRRLAAKRGGATARRITLDTSMLITEDEPDHLELHEALNKLEKLDPRVDHVVELRFFGGMKMQEIADVLEISLRTVEEDWVFARAWLRRALGSGES